ncbi:MAG TPA: hypothetical protein VE685_13525 [Thermoanaerobaculia bacterium]|nr:hypothetical protein [Thermoanaerobaculia bacterium]
MLSSLRTQGRVGTVSAGLASGIFRDFRARSGGGLAFRPDAGGEQAPRRHAPVFRAPLHPDPRGHGDNARKELQGVWTGHPAGLIEAFTLASGRLNELNLANVTLTNAAAQAGKTRFGICNICHFNAGAGVPGGFNINASTGVERAPDPRQTTEPHPLDGGFGAINFDCDRDGRLDCFGDSSFNVPPLIEAADTEPFFHNHSAATIEDAVSFYTTEAAFFGNPLPLTRTEVLNIATFLRVLNAAFNSAISIQRNTAALTLEKSRDKDTRDTVNMLLALSNSEAADAIEVLSHRKLHPRAIGLLNHAISLNSRAIAARPTNTRQTLIRSALKDLRAAKAQFGTGLDFTLGEGNLLF